MRSVILGLTALLLGAQAARADELVQIAPHRASPPEQADPNAPPLMGYLAKPAGEGRFPAVVLLHWCSGFGSHDIARALTLKQWGYVALALDSLGDRGMCAGGGGSVAEMIDAYAALRYLAERSFVAGERVAVMGWSMGGVAALEAVDNSPLTAGEPIGFRAAIAYYPPCQGITGALTAPALILIGEQDDWSLPDACRKLAARESDIGVSRVPGKGEAIDLVVYPNATHAFDSTLPPHRYMGHSMHYDNDATRDAEARVRAFLRATIGDQAAK